MANIQVEVVIKINKNKNELQQLFDSKQYYIIILIIKHYSLVARPRRPSTNIINNK